MGQPKNGQVTDSNSVYLCETYNNNKITKAGWKWRVKEIDQSYS